MTLGKKRVIRGVVTIVGLLVMAFASLPLWLPWIARPIASRLGFNYERYERLGYGRFALGNATFTNDDIRFEAKRIETAIPTALLWNRSRGGSEVLVRDWSLAISTQTNLPPTADTNTPATVVEEVQQAVDHFGGWIARVAVSNGVVMFQQQTVSVPWLVWSPPKVDAGVVVNAPRVGEVPAEVSVNLGARSNVSAQITAPKFDFRSTVHAVRKGNELAVQATNFWRSNQIVATAQFREDWVPQTATVSAPALSVVRTNLLGSGYDVVEGALYAGWTNGSFALQLKFNAASAQTNLPPIQGVVSVRGDTNSATVQSLDIVSTALRAQLSRPVEFTYDGKLPGGSARLAITGDLSRLPLAGMGGAIRGEVDVRPSTNDFPDVDASVELNAVTAGGVSFNSARAKGELHWPELHIREFNATLDSGARLQISGAANVTNQHISGARLRFEGQLPTNLVPPVARYSNLTIVAEAGGPLTSLVHRATVNVASVQYGPFVPADLEFTERGEQFRIAEFRVVGSTPGAAIEIAGSGDWNPDDASAQLVTLNYRRGGANAVPLYALAEPVNIQFAHQSNAPPLISLTSLNLRGEGRRVAGRADVVWPSAGNAQLSVAGLRSSDFTNLLAATFPAEVMLPKVETDALWSNGPVWVALNAVARIITTAAPPVELTFSGTNNAEAVYLSRLNLTLPESASEAEPLLAGNARFPVSATASSNGFTLRIHSNAPVRLELHTSTNEVVSTLLAEFARVKTVEPSLHLSLDGTLAQPRGTAHLSARSLGPSAITNEQLPRLENVRADLAFDPGTIQLNEFHATVAGQPITATAAVPLAGAGGWSSRVQVNQARADLQMRTAEIAAFAPLATNLIAPRGKIDVTLSVRPGLQLSGHVKITNAASASFPSVGPIQDINADIRLLDRAAIINSIAARAGGAPLAITGAVNFAAWDGKTNRWPDIRMRIRGTNVAIVREAQKIIRADLDLQITNVAQGIPAIGGVVNLRDSLYLASLNDLVPRGVKKPGQRPPYFSVDAEFLRDWRLDVRVQGEKFLTVRTPLFHGEVSANLDVRGPLREPLALGQVSINTARLSFPFATLSVKQGFVTLGSANPYSPEIFVLATGRTYDYDIRLEVTGTAQKPVLDFTSIPPLTSEQILLMITGGQIPRTDFALTTNQRAQKLGFFVGRNLLSQLGFGGGDENLTVRSGESISERGRSTYSVEYKLTEDVSLVGEYDRFDEYNAGVQWKVFSK